jgi:hypothetical protein
MNFLIETKQEYTIHLVNSINPLIYDGLQNIYEEAKKNAKNNDELKLFQILLSNVPKWNPSIIDNEYQRIIRLNSLGKTIEDLLKAIIKANITVLTNTNIDYNQELLKELNIQDDFKNFVHLVYIESARSFYNTPFLFSHRDPAIEIKRNQTEILKIIQECIKNAIRKMIPLQITIKTYLENKNNQIPTDLQSESKQIKNLLKSEKFKKSEVTPSSPRQLHEVLAATINSEGNGILVDNSKVFAFNNFPKESNSEKTLRDSILNMNTEEISRSKVKSNSGINNVFIPPSNINKSKPTNYSESSVYYEHKNNAVIEEYSNNLSMLKEQDDDDDKEEMNINNTKQEKTFRYFSNLNI